MRELWTTAKRMRNSTITNESEKFDGSWLGPFAQKICPDFAPPSEFSQTSPGSHPELDTLFTMNEFKLALNKIHNTSPGLDHIKGKLLKNLPDFAKEQLLELFNKFLENNIVPPCWREIKVIAIPKQNSTSTDSQTYRPIAMLSCLRKMFERMILPRLDSWLENNQLLSKTQYGFRKGKGCNDCLTLLTTDIQLAFGRKHDMTSIFLDVKGAFDSVC